MRIFFYPPFKPLDHSRPSGDLVIATGLKNFLADQGHQVHPVSSFRARWIYWKPWLWPRVFSERRRIIREADRFKPDLWLTYHTYYKAPDTLGPEVCRRAGLPYVIFQGMYSTKRRRRLKTRPGFYLNRKALIAARHVFSNRREDLVNLARLLPRERITYVPPGIYPDEFVFSDRDRETHRREWGVGDRPVVLSAAMFRPGVKTDGLTWVIRACGRLVRQGMDLILVIAGDGPGRPGLERLAAEQLAQGVRFVGQVPRERMSALYSAGDLFAFPGFRESLGMVYLEAQSCGLPVVACANGGVPEVVRDGGTGLLTPVDDGAAFSRAMARLLTDPAMARRMGQAGRAYVREYHDLAKNYRAMEWILLRLAGRMTGRGI